MSANHSRQPIDAPRFASLTPLIKPRSVVMIGASSGPICIGGRLIAYMLRHGYAGQIPPVNLNCAEVQGLPAFASVAELPQAPDATIVAVPALQVLGTVRASGRQGACSAIVLSSGFSGVGEVGAAMQDAAVAATCEHGIRLPGPNALGAFNSNLGYYAFFSTSLECGVPLPGRIGVTTQSGAYGACPLGMTRQRRLGTPICVATGSEADVTLGDSIGWLVKSSEIDVVMAYAESIRNVDSFLAVLEVAHRAGKSVILYKVGRNALGSRVALPHTASLAGDDKVLDAVLGDYIVTRARTIEELMNTAYLVTRRTYPVGSSFSMITVSGGAGIIVSDAAEEVGLPMSPTPDMAQERLKARPSFALPISPVDYTVQALNDLTLVRSSTESMAVDGDYRSLLAFFTQAGAVASIGAYLAEQFRQIKEAHPECLFVVSVMGEGEEPAPYEEAGSALPEDPIRAVVAIQATRRFGEVFAWLLCLRRPAGGLQLPASTFGEAEAKRLLARTGIESAAEVVLGSAEEAVAFAEGIGYPVVLKLASAGIQHKPEIGGVLFGVSDADAVRAGFQLLLRRTAEKTLQVRLDGVLAARQLQGGVGCFMGIQRNPLFGPVALFGLGGTFVEVLQDVVFRRYPFEVDEVEAMIRNIRDAPLLFGVRGQPRADVAALVRLLSNLSRFVWEARKCLCPVDLNPVIALSGGQGAWAVNAVLEIEEVAGGTRF